MKKCTVCGQEFGDDITRCPACRTVYAKTPKQQPAPPPEKEVKGELQSSILKYADFMDNAVLYKIALYKLSGNLEGDKQEAFEILRVLSYRGYYDAMYKLAECYLQMEPPEVDTAVIWLKMAADAGHVPSKIKLKMMNADLKYLEPIKIPAAGDLQTLVRSALPSVVTIATADERKRVYSCGSGFIIEGGFVITNAHVVGTNPAYVTAQFEPSVDDKAYNLMPLGIYPEYDVAILSFTGLAKDKFTAQDNLRLRLEDVSYGEDVYTIGNPLGLGFSVSHGVVSCPDRKYNYPSAVDSVLQTDITANPGNSGGAILDKVNNVVGMLTFHPAASNGGIAMCVPSKYIVTALNKTKLD